jgi:uncharacterized protein
MNRPPPTVHRGELDAPCQRHRLADLYVFGSRAAGIATRVRKDNAGNGVGDPDRAPRSDVDIAVRPLRNVRLTAAQFVEIAQSLETLFCVHRVDVVLLPTAPPYLALEAIRGELLWCADPDEQAGYELYVLRRAGHLAPLAERVRAAAATGSTVPGPTVRQRPLKSR